MYESGTGRAVARTPAAPAGAATVRNAASAANRLLFMSPSQKKFRRRAGPTTPGRVRQGRGFGRGATREGPEAGAEGEPLPRRRIAPARLPRPGAGLDRRGSRDTAERRKRGGRARPGLDGQGRFRDRSCRQVLSPAAAAEWGYPQTVVRAAVLLGQAALGRRDHRVPQTRLRLDEVLLEPLGVELHVVEVLPD